MSKTFVSGYWILPENKKNNVEHYLHFLPNTLQLINGENLIFYYNEDDIANLVKTTFKGNLKLVKKSIADLPTKKIADIYLESGKTQNNEELLKINNIHEITIKNMPEKGLAHYQREYKESGSEVYKSLFTIWTSKLFIIEECIKNNPFNTEFFSWIDSSASRININKIFYIRQYDNTAIYTHWYNGMKYLGKKLQVCAYFMIAHTNKWNELLPLYKKKLDDLKTDKYCHDEETILQEIYSEHKELFKSIKFEDETNKQNDTETNFLSAKQFVNMKIMNNEESLFGPGSHLVNTKETAKLFSEFIKTNNIKSVLDLGCGDWNWFNLVNLNGASYEGWDAHPVMIQMNTSKYGNDKIKFYTKDIITEEYPKVDLIICKDVLFHLDIKFSTKVVEKVKKSTKYFISTSFNEKEINDNIISYCSIKNWGFTFINLNIKPFNLEEYLIESRNEKVNISTIYIRYLNTYKFNN